MQLIRKNTTIGFHSSHDMVYINPEWHIPKLLAKVPMFEIRSQAQSHWPTNLTTGSNIDKPTIDPTIQLQLYLVFDPAQVVEAWEG